MAALRLMAGTGEHEWMGVEENGRERIKQNHDFNQYQRHYRATDWLKMTNPYRWRKGDGKGVGLFAEHPPGADHHQHQAKGY